MLQSPPKENIHLCQRYCGQLWVWHMVCGQTWDGLYHLVFYLVILGYLSDPSRSRLYSEIDHTYLSIEAQCVSHHYPRWTATKGKYSKTRKTRGKVGGAKCPHLPLSWAKLDHASLWSVWHTPYFHLAPSVLNIWLDKSVYTFCWGRL